MIDAPRLSRPARPSPGPAKREGAGGRLVSVALPFPLFQTFAYSVPPELDARVQPGSRVVVPVRNRRDVGIVIGDFAGARTPKGVRRILDAPDAEPAVTAELLETCQWLADYYVTPIGVVLRAVLPLALTAASMPTPRAKTRSIVRIKGEAPSLMEREELFGRARQQRRAYELLESLGGEAPLDHLRDQLGVSHAVMKGLATRGVVEIVAEEVWRDPFASRTPLPATSVVPTAAQSAAVAALVTAKAGEVFLLHGVTGSGKTLVYLELLREVVVKRGQTAIVLVPEIALTPQTVDRFRAVFGDAVAVLHSALSDGERYDAWRALRVGDRRIAVGARSAVFAPLPNLGAIVVDEEHEPSYKQSEAPRYHAREAAIVRAKETGAVVVLGSATPALETWANAAAGKYRLLSLPERVGGGALPLVEVIDLKHRAPYASAVASEYERAFSPQLDAALKTRLERGDQSILLLNRRGYSSFIQCTVCGAVITCPNCSITLTHHRTPERLLCHYCSHHEDAPTNCPRCGGRTLRQRGLGTQQVERLLGERFPAARIARMDMDTTTGKWAHATILDRVGAGSVDILLGTQMIAKGLDFPNVTLVGVVDADVGINLPDFRASERAFQLLSQVAGRAGRGPKGGEVIIQTRVPTHHAVVCALTHDYASFVAAELEGRKDPPYPPVVRLANIVLSGTQQEATADLALAAATWLRALFARRKVGDVELVGAAPSAIDRIQSRWRWHLLLKSSSPGSMTRVLRFFAERFPVPPKAQSRITIDRDPVSLL